MNRQPLRQVESPGLIMGGRPSHTTVEEAVELLSKAGPDTILTLCKALGPRDRNLPDGSSMVERAQGTIASLPGFMRTNPSSDARRGFITHCTHAFRTIATISNSNGFELSQAYDTMFATPNFFNALHGSLFGKYSLARSVLQLAIPLADEYRRTQNRNLESNLFALLLVAVVDISGPEDADDSEEDDGEEDDGEEDGSE
jgi:hypothetical protein